MPEPFDTPELGGRRLRNRFVRSATWEGLAMPDGVPGPRLIEMSAELAAGGVGLVITGHAYVSPQGRASVAQLGVYDDALLPGLSRLARVTRQGGAAIVLQLAHAGVFAIHGTGGDARAGRVDAGAGPEALGPSDYRDESTAARAMSRQEIAATVAAFAAAAGRARRAGFDAVQIHAAHGYLLSQFLSPHFNRRDDEYGGSVQRRAAVVLETVAAVREAVGPDYPVIVKMNSEDFLPDGLTVDDMLQTVALLEHAGVAAVELSGGTRVSGPLWFCRTAELGGTAVRPAACAPDLGRIGQAGSAAGSEPTAPPAYYEAAARRVKETVDLPLMLVGGIRAYETAERLVGEGAVDCVALSRPLIREPGLVARWAAGDRRPSGCTSDNACFAPARAGHGLYCVTARRRDRV